MTRLETKHALVAVLALALAACDAPKERAPAQEYEIDRTVTRGPVDLRVAASRGEITIAERLKLLVETRAREGYTAELPPFGDRLHEFGIVDYTSAPPRLAGDGAVVKRRTYDLAPLLSGEYVIAPMTATFRAQGDTLVRSIESDTIRVRVRSLLPADRSELELRALAGPVELPAGRGWLLPAALVSLLAAAVAAALLWRRRRARLRAFARAAPAHERAFARLEQLLARGLVEQGLFGEFTAAAADVLRLYVEERFGLRAPERTTEEFLAEAAGALPVTERQQRILADFLAYCDLVKFAALQPSREDVERVFDTCRDFVAATREAEEVEETAA